MDDITNFGLRVQSFRYYEQLKVVVDMKNSRSLGQGSRRYEQFWVVNDMNDLGSRKLRLVDAMNRSRLWMI